MNNEARQKLQELVSNFGSDISDNHLVWKGYLKDHLAQYQRECTALINALNENIPDELLSSQISVSPRVQVDRLVKKLEDDLGLQSEVARWAVESWAWALGVLSDKDLSPLNKPKGENDPFKQLKQLLLKLQLLRNWRIVAIGTAVGAIVFLSLLLAREREELLWGRDDKLTVGVLVGRRNPESAYLSLAEHFKSDLRRQLGTAVEVEVEVIESKEGRKSYDKVKEQLKNKSWDVAFTLSPMLSIAAIDNGYVFAARMFPGFPQYESALFVRADSPIKSEVDITSDTTIALEGVNSSHGFYMPIYDLYGKSLRVDSNNSNTQAIMEKVASRQVDVGAGIYEVLADPKTPELQKQFRIIGQSRGIPVAGVYISPDLTNEERDVVRKSLLSTPTEIQKAAQYGKGTEIDYSNFIEIVKRVDEILACTQWSQTAPVKFFCSGNTITGKVNGYNQPNQDTVRLRLQAEDGKVYYVVLSHKVLSQLGLQSVQKLSFQRISITQIQPVKQRGTLELRITAPEQIKIIN